MSVSGPWSATFPNMFLNICSLNRIRPKTNESDDLLISLLPYDEVSAVLLLMLRPKSWQTWEKNLIAFSFLLPLTCVAISTCYSFRLLAISKCWFSKACSSLHGYCFSSAQGQTSKFNLNTNENNLFLSLVPYFLH